MFSQQKLLDQIVEVDTLKDPRTYVEARCSAVLRCRKDVDQLITRSPFGRILTAACVSIVRLQRRQTIACGQGQSSASMRRVHTTPNTMTNLVLTTAPGPSECLICSELALLVLFCPCQHSVACEGGWRRRPDAQTALMFCFLLPALC